MVALTVAAVVVVTGKTLAGIGGTTSVACPATDSGCTPVATPGGVLTTSSGRYSVGTDGDTVVLGRWDCAQSAVPALLSRSTETVWVFDRWPTAGAGVAARPVATVPGAFTLGVVPGRRRCDSLRVARRGAAPVVLHPEPAP